MSDWRSYDTVADAYERIAAPRFQTVARHLLALVAPDPGARLLDLGTGTGAVPAAAAAMELPLRAVVGCDLSSAMLARASLHAPHLRGVRADVRSLPFKGAAFDVATANCVLSHVADCQPVLREICRVLGRRGRFATSSWEMAADAYTAAWRELLEARIGADAIEDAAEAIAPLEAHLASRDNVSAALAKGGFDDVRLELISLTFTHSVEEYVADRALGSSGRLGRERLGDAAWSRFLETAEFEFSRRFGKSVSYERRLVLAVGTLE